MQQKMRNKTAVNSRQNSPGPEVLVEASFAVVPNGLAASGAVTGTFGCEKSALSSGATDALISRWACFTGNLVFVTVEDNAETLALRHSGPAGAMSSPDAGTLGKTPCEGGDSGASWCCF